MLAEKPGRTVDCGGRVEGVHPESSRGRRHELHETLGAGRADRGRVELRLLFGHRLEQRCGDAVLLRSVLEQRTKLRRRVRRLASVNHRGGGRRRRSERVRRDDPTNRHRLASNALDLHHIAGVRSDHHGAVAGVDTNVIDGSPEGDKIAGYSGVQIGNRHTHPSLIARDARKIDSDFGVGVLNQAGAVESRWVFASPDVRRAEVPRGDRHDAFAIGTPRRSGALDALIAVGAHRGDRRRLHRYRRRSFLGEELGEEIVHRIGGGPAARRL